jgi:hypothetical protein
MGEVGVFLLCEVALGTQYRCYDATYVEVLPRGKHSTLGCGRTVPSPSASIYTYTLHLFHCSLLLTAPIADLGMHHRIAPMQVMRASRSRWGERTQSRRKAR